MATTHLAKALGHTGAVDSPLVLKEAMQMKMQDGYIVTSWRRLRVRRWRRQASMYEGLVDETLINHAVDPPVARAPSAIITGSLTRMENWSQSCLTKPLHRIRSKPLRPETTTKPR